MAEDTRTLAQKIRDAVLQLDHDYALASPTLDCPAPYEWTGDQLAAAESMLQGVLDYLASLDGVPE